MIYIGIDPGNEGAIGVQFDDGTAAVWDMPVIVVKGKPKKSRKTGKITVKVNTYIDEHGLYEIIRRIREKGLCKCEVEKVGVMPDQGSVSAFNFGKGYGIIIGILAALGIPRDDVIPQTWKKAMLAGMPKGKSSSRYRAKQLFQCLPGTFDRVKDDGRAEAMLMSEDIKRRCEGGLSLPKASPMALEGPTPEEEQRALDAKADMVALEASENTGTVES